MRDTIGQKVVLAQDFDYTAKQTWTWFWVAIPNDTVQAICARLGHPELAQAIAKRNSIRSVTQKLRAGRGIWMPRALASGLEVIVHFADGKRPTIKDGYAMFAVTDRPGSEGLTTFKGYNPLVMDLPVTFEGWTTQITGQSGWHIENTIRKLEQLAGRGPFPGAHEGPPAVVRVSVTDNQGYVVPLVPWSYQYTAQNPTTVRWRINGIDWADGALSDDWGRRVRADAVVHLWRYTPLTLAGRTV